MRLVMMGFVVFFCRRLMHELRKTVHQYEANEKAKYQTAEGQAKGTA